MTDYYIPLQLLYNHQFRHSDIPDDSASLREKYTREHYFSRTLEMQFERAFKPQQALTLHSSSSVKRKRTLPTTPQPLTASTGIALKA